MSEYLSGSEPPSSAPVAELVGASARLGAAIDNGELELPVLPAIAVEVLASSVDDQADAKRLAQLIQQDQSLASHVLRVVNTPIFRGTTEIVALQQAIARLGLGRIREIALTASVGETVFKASTYQHLSDAAWKKALAAGLWSKEVARILRKNVETAYLCGLLHNIGVPLILQFIDKNQLSLEASEVDDLVAQYLQPAGEMLVKDWNLPEITAHVIANLHDFQAAQEYVDEVGVVIAGIRLTELMALEELEVEAVVEETIFQFLNLYPEDLEQLLTASEKISATVESLS